MDQCKLSVEYQHAKGKTNIHGESPKRRPLMGKNKKVDVALVKGKQRN